MGLKVLLSLAITIIPILSLILYAQAYDYICVTQTTFNDHGWYYVWASAHGCFYVPSDGNLYDTWGGGSGFTDAPSATVSISVNYDERGCAGDVFRVRTSISIDTNGDGIPDHQDSVESAVRAPPCGAT